MGNRIRELRAEKNISQAQLASDTGISQQSLSFYEK
ncbi:helix-turn-helix transcriptional regulator [Ligilactobacillus murinus]|nr:helix-turn-helix transcriptional regulator [Ligilactobacillus murinus]